MAYFGGLRRNNGFNLLNVSPYYQLIAKGATVEVFVNGTLVNKGWDASVSEGAICFQAEKANIQFRNIRIKE